MLLPTPTFWYRRRPTLLAWLLLPLSWLYILGMRWHRRCSRPVRLPVPVVSLGNITLGGTGKTPLGIALARSLQQRGWRVAVLLRGYGAGGRQPCQVTRRQDAAAVGDEALEYCHGLADVQVWVGADRVASGRAAVAAGAELLLLDDGLQHWRLARDCDVSLLDRTFGMGNRLVFPAGPLREPPQQLGRADLLVLTGGEGGSPPAPPRGWPEQRPWVSLEARLQPPSGLDARPLLAFCGIGLPEKFFAALNQVGLQVVATVGFPDHHRYSRSQLVQLQRRAQARGATLVTTVKDWQRLPDPWRSQVVAIPLVPTPTAVEWITDAVLNCMKQRSSFRDAAHA